MKAMELRALSDGELQTKLDEIYEEMMNLRFNMSIGQQRDVTRLTELKRDVARIKTILRERQIARQLAAER
ncbi:MAG: 50S ribosomal protein L29 [Anaerolineae bacterium]|nr:50S ribosomal protein L29 [Caldilineales bacterium]MDW8268325.1 50S ribosomal protein L29 [Anaerolineae bacterium]